MKKIPLLPRYFRWLGLAVTIGVIGTSQYCQTLSFPTFAFFSGQGNFKMIETDMQLTILFFGTILGLLLIAFAKSKEEDEMIYGIRLFSWSWSIIISFLSFLLVTLFVYDSDYLVVMYFPQFMLLLFILLFNIRLYNMRKLSHEE